MQNDRRLSKGQRSVWTAMALSMAAGAFGSSAAHADYEFSGSIDIVSDYVFRGITEATESDGPAVQAGLDLEYDTGFYAGWWGSSLGYGSDNLATTVENDFFAGFAGETGEFSYDFGLNYYWYMDDSDASGFEPYASVGFAGVELGAAFMAQDISWSNQGDIYWSLSTGFDLGYDFSLDLLAGFYTFSDSGDYIPSTPKSNAFNSFEVTLTRQLADSPASMFATYILAGEDRFGSSQTDKIVFGFSYGF